MQNVSSTFMTAAKANTRTPDIYAKLTVGSTTYDLDGEDIVGGSVVFDGAIMKDGLELGTAIASSLNIRLDNRDNRWNDKVLDGAMLRVYSGLVLPDTTTEHVLLGTFIVDQPGRPYSELQLKASTRLVLLDRPFSELSVAFPVALGALMQQIANHCQVPFDSTVLTLPNMSLNASVRPSGSLTCRDIAGEIALAAGGNLSTTRDGKLTIKQLPSQTAQAVEEYTPQTRFSFKETSDPITITGIVHDGTVYGSDDYPLVIGELALLQGETLATVMGYLQTLVTGWTYVAATAEYQGNPALDLGDVISHRVRDGRTVKTILMRHKFVHGGKSQLVCDGKSATSVNYKDAHSRRIAAAAAKTEASVMQQVSSQMQASAALSDTLGLMMGFYSTRETLPDESTIQYWHNKPEMAESEIIWRFNGLALGVSNDGGSTWHGFDASANAVMRVIETITLGAQYIRVSETEDLATHLSAEGLRITSVTNRVTTAEGDILDTNERIDDLDASKDGRNLLLGSDVPKSSSSPGLVNYYTMSEDMEATKYTLTIKGELGEGRTNFIAFLNGLWQDGGTILVDPILPVGDTGLYRATFTGRVNSSVEPNRIMLLHYPYSLTSGSTVEWLTSESTVEWVKLEHGETGTAYSLAPEDLAGLPARVTTAEGNISTTQSNLATTNSNLSSVTNRVTDAEADITTAQQDIVELTTVHEASMELIGEALVTKVEQHTYAADKAALEDSINGRPDLATYQQLQTQQLQTQQTVDQWAAVLTQVQEQQVEDGEQMQLVTSYMAFDANGLTLGKSDSVQRLQLTNERINMIANQEIVSYWEGQVFYAPDLVARDRAQLGNHIFERTTDGRTVIRYAGD